MLFQALLLVVALVLIYKKELRRRNGVPGPLLRLPVLGHLPFLGPNPYKTLMKWGQYYGPVISVQMGSYTAIVINDGELIRKAFNMSSFAGRPHMKLPDAANGNRRGFTFSDGPHAMEQRKFSQRLLKGVGYGSNFMESRILETVPTVLDLFEDHLSKPLSVKHAFNVAVINAVWSIVAGSTFDKKDDRPQTLTENVSNALDLSTVIQKLVMFVKFVPEWLPELSGFNATIRGMLDVQKCINSIIEEHRGSKISGQPRDFIDGYLDEVEKTSSPESSFFSAHGNITFVVQELFSGGIGTTAATLEWLLFYLAKYPRVQETLIEEIDEELQDSGLPSSGDRPNLPYAEATIQEVLRISSIFPLAVFHSCLEDSEFNGYSILKGTMVIGNLHAVNHDKDIWGDPEIFRPERFLDSHGKFVKSENVLAFSCGKRACIGKQLSELQLFLYTVSIFQRFSVEAIVELPSEEGMFGLSKSVIPFQLHVRKRNRHFSKA